MKRESIFRPSVKTSLFAAAIAAAILVAVAPAVAGKATFGFTGGYTMKQSGNCNASNGPLTCVRTYSLNSTPPPIGDGLPNCKNSTESGSVKISDGPMGMLAYGGSLTLACTKKNYVLVKISGAIKAGVNTVAWSISSGYGAYSTASGSGPYSISFDTPKSKYTDTYTNKIKL